MSKAVRPSLVISVPGDDGFLGLIRDIAQKMAEHAGFDQRTSAGLAASVDQAALVAIGRSAAASGSLEVSFRETGRDLRVEVVDFGHALPASTASSTTSPAMDSVTYRREAGRNVCRLVKRKEGTRAG